MNFTTKLLSTACLALVSLSASAGLVPTYDSFGTLSAANFGGNGIANTAVAIDTFTGKNLFGQSTGTITLGLTVTPNRTGPAVSNDGHGTFTVKPGADKSNPLTIFDQLALWQIDYYVGGVTFGNSYVFKVMVDIDPSANENFKTFYIGFGNDQDSGNIGSVGNELFGGYSFNPKTKGQYSVMLEALQFGTDRVVGMTSILVDVKDVPEPASLALLGVAFGGLLAARRRKA